MAGIIPQVIVEVVATISGTIISIGIPLILAKLNKIGKVHTTLFGVEDVESMGGLVAVVESNAEKIEDVDQTAEEALETAEEVNNKVEELQDFHEEDN